MYENKAPFKINMEIFYILSYILSQHTFTKNERVFHSFLSNMPGSKEILYTN